MSSSRLQETVRDLVAARPPRAKSLIISVFGDSVLPHGGTIWLGSLIRLVEPLGLSERLVRTAVLRLSRDQWLTSQSLGRRSYYSLSEAGRRRFDYAHRRIYAGPVPEWDGRWCIVLLPPGMLSADRRDALRRELGWIGFGVAAANVLLHPSPDRPSLQQTLQEQGLGASAVVVEGGGVSALVGTPAEGGEALRRLVRTCWNLDQLADDYRTFLELFRPILRALEGASTLDPVTCFLIRTLIVHEYRRVTLRDPQLPAELLMPDWAGNAARLLCRNIYRLTEAAAERHLLATVQTADGPLPEAAASYYQRFGGLRQQETALAANG
ncbi:MAG: phenylacetic acid degradation operon negative regulatory protein PaaX [Rhodospirillaceae bacterium]|nr:phenylacetic acid degradation operon negative regulatory protein PaaX [Rhodospirillaceae bacterium]